jgi:hypothetical protein
LEGRERSSELVLVNRGDSIATYRLSIVEMRMDAHGHLERVPVNETVPTSAKGMIRFSPRQVTISPGGSQRVRVAIVKPAGLPEGEYRSHLLLEAVPSGIQSLSTNDSTALSVRFNVVGAVTLPVIVRHGQLDAAASLGQPELRNGQVLVNLKRTGDRSIRGDVTVQFQAAGSKKRIQVGLVRELPVYSPNTERLVQIAVKWPPGVSPAGGNLIVSFTEPGTSKRRAQSVVEATLSG